MFDIILKLNLKVVGVFSTHFAILAKGSIHSLVCSPCSQNRYPGPRGEQCWSKWGWCGYSVGVWARAVLDQLQLATRSASEVLHVLAAVMFPPTPGLSPLCASQPFSLLGHCNPCPSVKLHRESRGVRAVARFRLGCLPGQSWDCQ